jgi:hypothetical protein
MYQVHTVFEAGTWRNKVNGLAQGQAFTARQSAVAAGRAIALELHAVHVVHDMDGRVLEPHRYGPARVRRWVDPVLYNS